MKYDKFKYELGVADENPDVAHVWDPYVVVVEDRGTQRFLPVDNIEFDDKNQLVVLHV